MTKKRQATAGMEVEVRDEEFIAHQSTVKVNPDNTVSVEGCVIVQLRGPDGRYWVAERFVKLRAVSEARHKKRVAWRERAAEGRP